MTKKMYSVLSALLLFTALFVTACSDDNLDENNHGLNSSVEEYTIFSDRNGTRTSMDNTGKHHWMSGDKIWIKVGNDLVASDSTEIKDDTSWADFMFKSAYHDDEYPVIYSGSNATKVGNEFEVTIPSKQVQKTANNSEHYAVSGDCAIATAKKQDDGNYKFTLRHQMSYLIFEPRSNSDFDAKLKRITITELDGKNIAGTFTLDKDTCNVGNLKDGTGSNVIEVICGEDVEKAEADSKYAGSKNNGFTIKKTADPENNRIFVVIRPNNEGESYRLKVEFEMISYMEQKTVHDGSALNWDYEYTMHTETETREITASFKPNTFKTGRQILPLPAPPTPEFTYQFEDYYMWGAQDWFWKGAAKYPYYNDESQKENQPEAGTSRWYDDDYQLGDTYIFSWGGINYNGCMSSTRNVENEAGETVKASNYTYRHRQAQWNNVLTANELTFYVQYGDPHYDNVTQWVVKTYNGTYTICYGGVWLKTKAAICRDNVGVEARWAQARNDGSVSNSKDALGAWNLRYCAPSQNTDYRMEYKNKNKFDKKPWDIDPSKKKEDYFFLPCLGRIEYNGKGTAEMYGGEIVPGTSDPTMTLVGSQGFYWSKTPVQNNLGNTRWTKYAYGEFPTKWDQVVVSEQSGLEGSEEGSMEWYRWTKGDYNDNAFYFNIHFDYIAVSWQQPGIYVKTGMRKATTSIFK